MTLMELTVALTISSIAIALGYAALSTLSDRRTRAEQVTRALLQSTSLRQQLREWIGGAVGDETSAEPAFRGRDRTSDGVPNDELSFITIAETPLGAPRTQVTLRIARDSSGRARGLSATFADPRRGARQEMMLDAGIHGFDARYLPSFIADSAMLSTWSSRTILPLAVAIQFVADPESPAMLTAPLLVPLRATQ